MARSRFSVILKRSLSLLVIFPFIITGVVITCAALPLMCLYSLAIISAPLKAGNHHADAVPDALALGGRRSPASIVLASAADQRQQDIQFPHSESRPPTPQPLLQSLIPSTMTAGVGAVSGGQGLQFIRLDAPTLAPMAFTRFCLQYPSDCQPEALLFGADRIALDKIRRSELESVNHAVNASIHPQRNDEGVTAEKWLLSPARGDCNDYAVTKRHQLITMGWLARTVLLSEVVTASGEHHLVTVVRTDGGDLVLDNLTDQIMPWSRTPYRWLRMQTPKNPNYWAAISERGSRDTMTVARRETL